MEPFTFSFMQIPRRVFQLSRLERRAQRSTLTRFHQHRKWPGGLDVLPPTMDFINGATIRTAFVCIYQSVANLVHCMGKYLYRTFSSCMPVLGCRSRRDDARITEIQAQARPIILQRDGLVDIAEKGCGKSIAYVLPMLIKYSGTFWKDTR